MPLGFFAHNMSLSEFANECERKTDTIADWRKRGMIQSYGRPHPSHDGRWLYSREDAMAVYISGMLKDYAGLAWTSALDAGMQITKIILVLPINRMSIGGIAYIFETENKTNVSFQVTAEEAFNAVERRSSGIAVARAVEIKSIFNHLPGDYQEVVKSIQAAN